MAGWASHLMEDASITSSPLRSFARLTSVTPHLSFTGESSTGHSIPHVASPVLSWGEGSLAGKALPSTAWRHFCKGALLAHASFVVDKDNQVLLYQATGAWVYACPMAELCTCLFWTSGGQTWSPLHKPMLIENQRNHWESNIQMLPSNMGITCSYVWSHQIILS